MADTAQLHPLTGHREFDGLIADFAELRDPAEIEAAHEQIWDRFGTEGAVFISDMASFSSTSRKSGVCHYLKMIHRARQVIAPVIADNDGLLLKCDADNTYAFFAKTSDAIQASFDVNAAMFKEYLRFIANRRATQIGLEALYPNEENPFPWMSEMIDLKKERNFFETRVIDYQSGGALSWD